MSTAKRRGPTKGKSLPRWSSKETEFLRARLERPFIEVYEEFKTTGYKRTKRAASVKFYALKQKAGRRARGGRSAGKKVESGTAVTVASAAVDLAMKHDVVTLKAALDIRRVLGRLA